MPYAFVTVRGPVPLSDELAGMRQWANRIAERYMGAELADRFGARNAVDGELLVRLHITQVTAFRGIAD